MHYSANVTLPTDPEYLPVLEILFSMGGSSSVLAGRRSNVNADLLVIKKWTIYSISIGYLAITVFTTNHKIINARGEPYFSLYFHLMSSRKGEEGFILPLTFFQSKQLSTGASTFISSHTSCQKKTSSMNFTGNIILFSKKRVFFVWE